MKPEKLIIIIEQLTRHILSLWLISVIAYSLQILATQQHQRASDKVISILLVILSVIAYRQAGRHQRAQDER